MTDNERPKSILQLPEELTRVVILDLELNAELITNHILVALDPLISVLRETYGTLLEVRLDDNRLVIMRIKDNGELVNILQTVQDNWDREDNDDD